MLYLKVNQYLTLRLEYGETNIYVNGRKFNQCKYLLLNLSTPKIREYDYIQSIDEAAETLDRTLENHGRGYQEISPETEFWGHCSNLQAWAENDYDTRILHRNLAFPLLKALADAGDPIAKRKFKEEIAMRLVSGHSSVVEFLMQEGYLSNLSTEEVETLFEIPEFVINLFKDKRVLNTIYNLVSPAQFNQKILEFLDNAYFDKNISQLVSSEEFLGFLRWYANDSLNYFKVLEIYNKFVIIESENSSLWNSIGYRLTYMNLYRKALVAYKNSIITNPKNGIAWNNLAWNYNHLKEYENAIKAAEISIKINAVFAYPYNHLGFALYKTGNYSKGIEYVNKSKKLNPKYHYAWYNLARISYMEHNYQDALEKCEQCLQIDGDFQEGVVLYEKLIEKCNILPDNSIRTFSGRDRNTDVESTHILGAIKVETEKAVLINFFHKTKEWVPKSKIHTHFAHVKHLYQDFLIDKWVLQRKKLIV
jgi:hypothetical protein